MRALMLLLAVTVATTAETASWSGRIVIEDVRVVPDAEAEERTRLLRLIAHFEDRIDATHTALPQATPAEKHILIADLAAFDRERAALRLELGGEVVRATRRYHLAQVSGDATTPAGRMLVRSRDYALLVDRDAGQALVRTWEGRESKTLAPLPAPLQTGNAAEPMFGVPSGTCTLMHDDRQVQVRYTAAVPNPYAVARIETQLADRSVAAALAAVPGLPLTVRWQDEDGTHLLRVTELDPQPIDPTDLTLPEQP